MLVIYLSVACLYVHGTNHMRENKSADGHFALKRQSSNSSFSTMIHNS